MTFTIQRQCKIITMMTNQTGIDPTQIYCQTTGAPIGQLCPHELDLMFATIDSAMSDDAVIDELYVRTLATMRPSPVWTLIKPSTINRLRITDPRRLAAYLMGRLFEPRDAAYSRTNRSLDQRLTDGANRIICFNRLEAQTDLDVLAIKDFVKILCFIDSDFDLSLCDNVPNFPKTPLDIKVGNLGQYTETLWNYYLALSERKAALEHQARLHDSWLRSGGNRVTKTSRTNLIEEIKAKAESLKAKTKAKPKSAKAAAEEAMIQAMTLLMGGELNDDIIGLPVRPAERAPDSPPTSTPTTPTTITVDDHGNLQLPIVKPNVVSRSGGFKMRLPVVQTNSKPEA